MTREPADDTPAREPATATAERRPPRPAVRRWLALAGAFAAGAIVMRLLPSLGGLDQQSTMPRLATAAAVAATDATLTVPAPTTAVPSVAPTASATPVRIATATTSQRLDVLLWRLPAGTSAVVVPMAPHTTVHARDNEEIPAGPHAMLFVAMAVDDELRAGHLDAATKFVITDADKADGSGILRYAPAGTTLPLLEMVRIMVEYQDATAANMLLDELGGPDAVNDYLASVRMRGTVMRRRFGAEMTTAAGRVENTTTLRELSMFYIATLQCANVSRSACGSVFTAIERRSRKNQNWMARDLGDRRALHYSSSLPSRYLDIGVIYDGPNPIAVVAMAVRDDDSARGTQRISSTTAEIAKLISDRKPAPADPRNPFKTGPDA